MTTTILLPEVWQKVTALDFQGAQKELSKLLLQEQIDKVMLGVLSKVIGAESAYLSFDYFRSSAFRVHVISINQDSSSFIQ